MSLRAFTVHLEFLAETERDALTQAQTYAEALNLLRPEVGTYPARVSPSGNWSASTQVYCCASGPWPTDVCTDVAGHHGTHLRLGALRWSDDQVPGPPDAGAAG